MDKVYEGEQGTNQAAEQFVSEFCHKKNDTAFVVGLSGDLGAGKTTFTKEVARILGVVETVVSPTFVIEKIYKLTGSVFENLIHIDAYRLKNPAELTVLGWDELIKDPKNLILVEWPENIKGCLPDRSLSVNFEHVNENSRGIKW